MKEREPREINPFQITLDDWSMETRDEFLEDREALLPGLIRLPYSDLEGGVHQKEIYSEAMAAFPLYRLNGIKALSYLNYRRYQEPYDENHSHMPPSHTRFVHTFEVAFIAEEIAKRNWLSKEDTNYLIVGSLLHDIATPALGDAAKKLDHARLDEEDNWKDLLDDNGRAFLKKYGLDEEKIDQIIHNQGLLGQILDVADKIAYVCQDAFSIAEGPKFETVDRGNYYTLREKSRAVDFDEYYLPINHILSHFPNIGNIYKDVYVDQQNSRVVFQDSERLAALLRLREHLFKHFYVDPVNQGRDLFYAKMLGEVYSPDGEGQINPSSLRRMTDQEVEIVIGEHYKERLGYFDVYGQFDFMLWLPKFEEFYSMEEAGKRAEELASQDGILIIDTRKGYEYNPGIDFLTVDELGKPTPFKEVEFSAAQGLEDFAKSLEKYFVFYADTNTSDSSKINNLIKKVLLG